MISRSKTRRARLGTAFVALAIGLGTVAAPAPAVAQSAGALSPSETLNLSPPARANHQIAIRQRCPMCSSPIDAVADVHVTSERAS